MSEVNRRGWCALGAVLLASAAACGDDIRPQRPDAAPGTPDAAPEPDAAIDAPPVNPLDKLAGTGLCANPECTQFSVGVREYVPRFQLWDDAATKRRWIYLPPGTKIDTTDMDYWVFPVGTKLWKEFSRDGTRVETRLLMKQIADDTTPGAWFYATYQWNQAQNDAMVVTSGVRDANGTQHDIPSRSDCRACHDRLQPTRILGFGAIQLDYDAPAGMPDLDSLIADGLLSAPPAGGSPHFPLPGTAVDTTALGYLHANCGHCHNPTSDVAMGTSPLDLRLRASMLATVADTPAYKTAVGIDASIPYTENGQMYTKLIVPQDPQISAVISRMNTTMELRFMPAVAVETVDPAGQQALVAWINSL
ncbi:MAG TPA: hypothetical protein VNO30_27190 [Kofleriaceae bacterium]|nr:hypothetical protein [Kofleriaceae bacterium]